MQVSAHQIATLVQGRLEGNPEAIVSNVAKIEEAGPGDLCFLSNPKYEEFLYTSGASVVLVNDSFEPAQAVSATLIRVKDAYSSFANLLEQYRAMMAGAEKKGIESPSQIAESARLGKDIYVGAFCYIGENVSVGDGSSIYPGCYIGNNVKIGINTLLYPGVRIYADTVIGSNVVIHAGCVLGSDGFGFAPLPDGSYKKIAQIGNVVIEDDVEIGTNTTIDRATMGSTTIRKGVKLDNLIQIAHNVEIGANTVIAAQTGISGSTKIGRNCIIGGQVGIVGHIHIADGTRINAQSGVSKAVATNNSTLNGTPAFDYKSSLKSQAIFRNLPEVQQRIQRLEEQVQELTALLSAQNLEYKK